MIQRKWDVGELRNKKSFVTFVDTTNVSLYVLSFPKKLSKVFTELSSDWDWAWAGIGDWDQGLGSGTGIGD